MEASKEPQTNRTTDQKWRTLLFSIGVISALLSAGAGICSCVDHFPLLANGQGGYRQNPTEDLVLFAGLLTGLASMAFGAFGKGVGRILLIATGLLLTVFNLLAWLGNNR